MAVLANPGSCGSYDFPALTSARLQVALLPVALLFVVLIFIAGGCNGSDTPEREPVSRTQQGSERPSPGERPSQGELLLRGGTVVAGDQIIEADIRVRDGKISEIGSGLKSGSPSEVTIDCTGKHLLPGGIDPHVHLSAPWCDDFQSGSRAAIAGGITTLGHMSFPERGRSLQDSHDRNVSQTGQSAICDLFFHYVFTDPAAIDSNTCGQLREFGQPDLKLFMLTNAFSGFRSREDLFRLLRQEKIVAVIHAEDQQLLEEAKSKLIAAGTKSLTHYGTSRPVEAEVKAVMQAIELCNKTGCTVYLVHISSARALNLVEQARLAGTNVFLETRPMYLHLTDEVYQRDDAGLFIGMPPVRSADDRKALWAGIRDGTVATVATDHAPWTREQKLANDHTITNPLGGVNNLQVMLPMLMDAVVKEEITLQQFTTVTATNAAEIFGMADQKGKIAVGLDADIVVWDLGETRVISGDGFSRAGFSIYEGTEVTGWPTITLRRGEVVFRDGEIVAEAGGRVVQRKPGEP